MKFRMQLLQVKASQVAQLDLFQVLPQPFHRVEVRRIRRQRLQVDSPAVSPSSPATAAFPILMQGRRPHWTFRGLLNVHALRPVGSPHRHGDTSVSKAPTVSLPPPTPR